MNTGQTACMKLYVQFNINCGMMADSSTFWMMRGILDSKMKELSGQGIGIERKRADIITEPQEDTMWSKGVLGRDTHQKLLDTLLFQLGLHFTLRAGQGHKNLTVGTHRQISILIDASGT